MNLPAGWSWKILEQVASVRTGIALSRRKLKDPVTLPYMRVKNVQDGYLDLRQIKHMTIERQQMARYLLAPGDVLMTEGGDFDKLGRGDVWHGQIRACLHQNHVFAVRPDKSQILPGYLSALTASRHGREYFLRAAKKSTNLASINSSQLKQFPVPLPPLAQQHAMVQVLSSWNQAIAASNALIANSELQKKAWQQQLFSGQYTVGDAAPAWRSALLSEIAQLDPESLGKKTPADFAFRYIALGDVAAGQIRSDLPSHTLASAPSRARRLVRPGQLLLSTVRPNLQGFARVTQQHADCVASTGFVVLAAKQQTHADYLFHYLYSDEMAAQMQSVVAGTNYPQMNPADVANLVVRLPALAEQQAIAAILDMADQRIVLEKRARDLLLLQKMDIIEQFISGQHCFD